LALSQFQVVEKACPGRSIGLRDRGEFFPRKLGLDLRDVCGWWASVLGVAAVDRPSHAAHQCGDFGSDREFAAGAGVDEADAFDPADLRGLGPFPRAHVHLGVVYPERFDLDDNMTRLWFGIRDFLDYQVLGPNFCMTIARMIEPPNLILHCCERVKNFFRNHLLASPAEAGAHRAVARTLHPLVVADAQGPTRVDLGFRACEKIVYR
jgi:hypothetical protein